ncbi:MAG: flagellar export protein FliJ, partial [Verrucomicrobiota bacterium]|nr:flagellar export protein FliJ [Verrucomicrobiota bacterium]
MKAFTFRLETLLHLREMAKDKAIAEYGVAIHQREESEKLLDQGHRALDDLKREIGLRRTVGFSGSEQESYNRSINHAKERIIDLNASVQEARKVEDFKRSQYLETDSSFKSLLRL